MSTPIRDRLKFYALVLLVSFFAALFLYSRSPILLDAFTHKDNQNAFYKGEKGIALTFNITWGKENAETILNVLEKADYRSATFFLSGAWAEKNQHIVKEIVNKKYETETIIKEYSSAVDIDFLLSRHKTLQNAVIAGLYENAVFPDIKKLEYRHILYVGEILKKSNASIDLPGFVTARVSKNKLTFEKITDKKTSGNRR